MARSAIPNNLSLLVLFGPDKLASIGKERFFFSPISNPTMGPYSSIQTQIFHSLSWRNVGAYFYLSITNYKSLENQGDEKLNLANFKPIISLSLDSKLGPSQNYITVMKFANLTAPLSAQLPILSLYRYCDSIVVLFNFFFIKTCCISILEKCQIYDRIVKFYWEFFSFKKITTFSDLPF